MKYLVIPLGIVVLSGCGAVQRATTAWFGKFTYKCSKSGVEYVQSDSGIAVHLDQAGKPVICAEGD